METTIIDIIPNQSKEYEFYCVKNKKKEGYKTKKKWFEHENNSSARIKMAMNNENKPLGFIEYTDSEKAWRPVEASNYLFITCIMVHGKKDRNQNIASNLIKSVLKEAESKNKSGVCVMTSKGTWMADKSVFEKNDFLEAEKKGRFELMYKNIEGNSDIPKLRDWEEQLSKYQGWNLIYADQCPWHEKSVKDLLEEAKNQKIDLKITKFTSPEEAQNSPSGFGTFAIVYNGKLLEDHYISKTRFKNILKKELK